MLNFDIVVSRMASLTWRKRPNLVVVRSLRASSPYSDKHGIEEKTLFRKALTSLGTIRQCALARQNDCWCVCKKTIRYESRLRMACAQDSRELLPKWKEQNTIPKYRLWNMFLVILCKADTNGKILLRSFGTQTEQVCFRGMVFWSHAWHGSPCP